MATNADAPDSVKETESLISTEGTCDKLTEGRGSDQPIEGRSTGAPSTEEVPIERHPAINMYADLTDYKICRQIATGSFSTVRQCIGKDGKRYALKTMTISTDGEDHSDDINNEISILSKLKHPNIVRLFEVAPGYRYYHLILEHAYTVLPKLYARTAIKLKNQKFFQYQILQAISYCHANGIIHRDIKPDNILITATDGVKLCDFGSAVEYDVSNDVPVKSFRWWGTILYRAPEACERNEYTTAVDIWSAGCTFAEMVLRHEPFHHKSYGRSIIDHIKSILPEFKASYWTLEKLMSSRIDTEGNELIISMLRYKPTDRPKAKDLLKHHFYNDIDRSHLPAPDYTGD